MPNGHGMNWAEIVIAVVALGLISTYTVARDDAISNRVTRCEERDMQLIQDGIRREYKLDLIIEIERLKDSSRVNQAGKIVSGRNDETEKENSKDGTKTGASGGGGKAGPAPSPERGSKDLTKNR